MDEMKKVELNEAELEAVVGGYDRSEGALQSLVCRILPEVRQAAVEL